MLNYEMNKEMIAKTLCEKKAEPKSCCKGKCYMKKQLEKDDKKDQSPVNNFKEKFEVQFFSENKIPGLTSFAKAEIISFQYLFPSLNSHSASVFHPPSGDFIC